MTHYAKIEDELKCLPMTWYPALIKVMIESAISKHVFISGGATEFVRKIEANHVAVMTSDRTDVGQRREAIQK